MKTMKAVKTFKNHSIPYKVQSNLIGKVNLIVPVEDTCSRSLVSNLNNIVGSDPMSVKGSKDLIPSAILKVSFLKLKGVHGRLKDGVDGPVNKIPVGAVYSWVSCG